MFMFNKDSYMVKSALIYFDRGIYTQIDQVPDLYNLRQVVAEELVKLGKMKQEEYDKIFK